MTLKEAKSLAVKVLSKTMDSTTLGGEKCKFIYIYIFFLFGMILIFILFYFDYYNCYFLKNLFAYR
jgi:hypothetical protein